MSSYIQIATQKPITNFVNTNIKDEVDGEIVTFKYGGLYYTRFLVPDKDNIEDNVGLVYGILIKHIRKQLLKTWIFERDECKHLTHAIRKPIYRDELGQITMSV